MEEQKESPEYSVYAVKNTRRFMEDRHVVIPNLLSQFSDKGDKQYSYYAVFDGHAGPDAAQFAADNLHKNFVESSFFQSGNVIDALRHAYALTDFQYTEKSERDGVKSGCTAVTCLLENNERLYMAWVGDSIALLSRNGKPCFIMEPHNLERDDEKERVESMGGAVLYFDTWRVDGTLSVSRAIGDPGYKPYVCSDPDIEKIELDGTEDFLIIGCDGLWDRMSPEDAIGLIYQHLQANSHLEASEIVADTAKLLSERAINDGSSDNVTTIVIFLRDVASILSDPNFVPSELSSNNVIGAKLNSSSSDNNSLLNSYDQPTALNNMNNTSNNINNNINNNSNSNSNNNNYDNGLIDTLEYDNGPLTNKEEVMFGASEDIKEENIDSQLVVEGKSSTLNPFADEFQPNITTSNNIIPNQFGNEPKKDDDGELHKNDGLEEKKDLWMSESKNDGNNEQHQQQHYPNQAEEMLDALVVNGGLSASENLFGSVENQPKVTSQQFEEESNIIHSSFTDESRIVQENDNAHDFKQEPTAPELISIDQEQFTTMESHVMSQAETFVGNLTPTETPSSPVVTNKPIDFPSELSIEQQQQQQLLQQGVMDYSASQYSFDTCHQSNPESNVNQYITSVSDAMSVSEPYHDPYFASDSVEPESIIVNPCDDVISSGPHAIDPYSENDNLKEVESELDKERIEVPLHKEEQNIGREEEIGIEVTDNVPCFGSSNPFGSNIVNESHTHGLPGEFESIMKPIEKVGKEKEKEDENQDENKNNGEDEDEGEKSFFTEDNNCSVADNSSALLDFSADQVNEIVLSPYRANESSIMESKFEESIEEPVMKKELISEPEVSPGEKLEDLSVVTEKTTELSLNDKFEENLTSESVPICESNQTKNMTELICGSTEEKEVNEAISSVVTESLNETEETGKSDIDITSAAINAADADADADADATSASVSASEAAISAVSASNSAVAAAASAAAAAVTVAASAAAISNAVTSSKNIKSKESTTQIKNSITKKSTVPLSKTINRTATSSSSSSSTIGSLNTKKPLSASSTTRITSSTSSKPTTGLAFSKPPSRPPTSTSTSTVKSSVTSRIGATSTLNKKPTQTASTASSGTSRVSSLASRTSSTALSSSSSSSTTTTTGKPSTRTSSSTTSTTSSTLTRKPATSRISTSTGTTKPISSTLTKSTLSSRTTTAASSRTVTSASTSSPRTGVKETDKKEPPKRTSTGSMLNRPSPGASSLTNKANQSALNRSMTNSSRPGTTTKSTVSEISTRPSTTSSTLSSTRSPGLSSTSRSIGATKSSSTTTKSTTSTNKVAVSRLGANKKPTASNINSKAASTTATTAETTATAAITTTATSSSATNSPQINTTTGDVTNYSEQKTSSSSPVDLTTTATTTISTPSNAITNSIKRDKNMMPNSANSLKDELEAALASPISSEDKGVIKGTTKDNEPSENL